MVFWFKLTVEYTVWYNTQRITEKGTSDPCGSLPNYSMEEIMKKILSIALVALLAVSSVFAADFSGSASVGFGYNLDTKDYGFKNSDSTKIDIKADYKTGIYPAPVEKSEETEEAPAPSIYAGIKAAFTIEEKISNNACIIHSQKLPATEYSPSGIPL